MANNMLLIRSLLPAFRDYALSCGYQEFKPTSEWEVLRMKSPVLPTIVVYQSKTCHSKVVRDILTTPPAAASLFRKWAASLGIPEYHSWVTDSHKIERVLYLKGASTHGE